jgi:hypothetical protein
VLVLSPPWRTVLVLVIERFAVHGINATCVTAHKPPFPNERIMLLISIILSFTKFLPEQRVDRDGMIQTHDRSSTSTSTSTKNSQNKTMHRSGWSATLNYRNHFGGHSVMVADRCAGNPLVSCWFLPSQTDGIFSKIHWCKIHNSKIHNRDLKIRKKSFFG